MPLNTVEQLRAWMGIADTVDNDYIEVVSASVESELLEWSDNELPSDGSALARYRLAHMRLVKLDIEYDRVTSESWGDRQASYRRDYEEMRHSYLTPIRWR